MIAQQFIREYWQKKPLLIRGAFPGFGDMLTADELAGLACEADAQSRLVLHARGKWKLEQGPFEEERFAQLPDKGWSLLVQGVNHVLPQAQALLAEFAFIPYARLDDLMVSYAPPGGGVGPHFDSYDVFLLQGAGRRRWQIGSQRDLALVDGAPLKILRNFRASREWELAPGDLLYLPPRCAHDGVAIEDCITYSIGFRAPSAQDLCARFLEFVQDGLDAHGLYADPQLKPTRHPARIDRQLSRGLLRLLEGARWNRSDTLRFIGMDLSTPKPHVVYVPPHRPLSPPAFAKAIVRHGLRLALPSILLYDTTAFYINGERWTVPARARTRIRQLADRRELPPATVAAAALDTLHAWYRAGYVVTG